MWTLSSPPLRAACVAVALLTAFVPQAAAQFFPVNGSTTVSDIDFTFATTQTFERDALQEQIATQAPKFFDTVRRILPFVAPRTYPFDPVELQKDVVRLRRFYERNGFLNAWVEYRDSRLDTTDNAMRVVFDIDEGPPLIIQDVNFFAPDSSYATTLFEGAMRDRWIDFRDRTSFKTGDRFTNFDLVRIQDQIISWLKDRSYAFARFDTTVTAIDSTAYTADIAFYIDPGPPGIFSEIQVEGNRSVNDMVVRRELPFHVGSPFSNSKLVQGQRELFGLNLFRVALADVPPQPRDSTVTVRLRVREANLRYLTAQTGYSSELGVSVEGQWTHRNFIGGARNLTVGLVANTGLYATPPTGSVERRLLRPSVSLRQPYLFVTSLSGVVEPFLQYERDPLLEDSDRFLQINRREVGANTTLIYELLPFRTVSAQYRVSRATQFSRERADADSLAMEDPFFFGTQGDAYSVSRVTLSGTFGRVNNFINPRRGFLVRPIVEKAGTLGGLLNVGIEYLKAGGEVVGYLPITRRVRLGVRLTGGRLWPTDRFDRQDQFTEPFEDRFDPARYYAGGANDVRGWDLSRIGPKFNRTEFVRDTTSAILFGNDGLPQTDNEFYEAVGGLAKLAGNVELRLPFPGLGSKWRTAAFLDFGQVSAEEDLSQECPRILRDDEGNRIVFQCGFRDDGNLALNRFKFGVGAGIRYETAVGYIRLDLAYKLNPDDQDLLTPREAFLNANDWPGKPADFGFDPAPWRRLNIHLSLGQAF